MMENRERLLRFLEGDLPEKEAHEIRARMEREPALQQQVDRLQRLRHTLSAGTPDSFAPYFSERVLRRLGPVPAPNAAAATYESLRWAFRLTAAASLLIAGILGAYNVVDYQSLDVVSTIQEALFGLPSASLPDALYFGAL